MLVSVSVTTTHGGKIIACFSRAVGNGTMGASQKKILKIERIFSARRRALNRIFCYPRVITESWLIIITRTAHHAARAAGTSPRMMSSVPDYGSHDDVVVEDDQVSTLRGAGARAYPPPTSHRTPPPPPNVTCIRDSPGLRAAVAAPACVAWQTGGGAVREVAVQWRPSVPSRCDCAVRLLSKMSACG